MTDNLKLVIQEAFVIIILYKIIMEKSRYFAKLYCALCWFVNGVGHDSECI